MLQPADRSCGHNFEPGEPHGNPRSGVPRNVWILGQRDCRMIQKWPFNPRLEFGLQLNMVPFGCLEQYSQWVTTTPIVPVNSHALPRPILYCPSFPLCLCNVSLLFGNFCYLTLSVFNSDALAYFNIHRPVLSLSSFLG